MFEKLISLLPYNPGMLQQLSFYGRRMREEAGIRRTGLIFLVLSFMVQFFAVIAPPQITSAASNNDLINGGFNSASQAAKDCNSNIEDYSTILKNYGITCSEVSNSSTVTIKSTADNKQLFSMGRLPYGLAGETPVNISGATYYMRYLWAWDTNGPSSYQALKVTAQNGTTYYLLYACGNLVSVGLPKPIETGGSAGTVIVQPVQTPTPNVTVTKSMWPGYPAAGSQVTPGTTLAYKIEIDNAGATANSVDLSDVVPVGTTFSFMSQNDGASSKTYSSATRTADWQWATIPQETGTYVVQLRVTVDSTDTNGQQICNQAGLNGGNLVNSHTSNTVCVAVTVPTTPTPQKCEDTIASNYGGSLPCTYLPVQQTCQDTTANNYGGVLPCTYPTTPTPTPTPTPCTYDTSIAAASSECKPCEASVSSDDTIACVTVHKTAANLTQGLSDANNTTANPGDSILYTLYADNTGKGDVRNYVFTEDLSDVMDYADPVDLHGGTIDNSDQVTWPSQTIAAGQTATEQITVKVKDPIPTTPQDPGDPGHFDGIMTNVYGNTININVPPTPITTVETASTTLPNTGPGAGIFIAAAIVIISAYFYSRARLLSKESAMAVQENSGGLN